MRSCKEGKFDKIENIKKTKYLFKNKKDIKEEKENRIECL